MFFETSRAFDWIFPTVLSKLYIQDVTKNVQNLIGLIIVQ